MDLHLGGNSVVSRLPFWQKRQPPKTAAAKWRLHFMRAVDRTTY